MGISTRTKDFENFRVVNFGQLRMINLGLVTTLSSKLRGTQNKEKEKSDSLKEKGKWIPRSEQGICAMGIKNGDYVGRTLPSILRVKIHSESRISIFVN